MYHDEEEKELEEQGFRISDDGDEELPEDAPLDMDFGLDEEDPDKDS